MSGLEKKWWFTMMLSFFSVLFTIALLKTAGIWPAHGIAQLLIYFICFIGIWKCLSFLGWLALLLASPKSKALD